MVLVPVYHLHRDPEYWPDPETFDPERYTSNPQDCETYAVQTIKVDHKGCTI